MSSLVVDLADSPGQTLVIQSRNRPLPPDAEEPLRDPVALFAEAALAGMFDLSAPVHEVPLDGTAEILEHFLSADGLSERWTLRLDAVDPAALRVLASLLLARAPESLSLTHLPPTADAARAPAPETHEVLRSLPGRYPARRAPPLFPVIEVEPDGRRSRDRALRVVLAAELTSAVAARAVAGLDLWAQLLLCGGYPHPGQAATSSGALPEPAFQLDSHTVEIAFPEAFFCDEAAFESAVSFAARLHRGGAPVEYIEIQ